MVLFPPFQGPNAITRVLSNDTGRSYWVVAQAPSSVLAQGAPIGNSAELLQYQYFRKTDANARLQLVVTQAFFEGIDGNGGDPTALECPWHRFRTSFVDCRRIMSSSTTFDVTAFTPTDQKPFLKTGGWAELIGFHGFWYFDAHTSGDATVPLWDRSRFEVDLDFEQDGGGRALVNLAKPIRINVPLSSIPVEGVFSLSVKAKASTFNHRQRESYLAAAFKDPVEPRGLGFRFTGLEPVETPTEKPPILAPAPAPACTTGPDPAAGRLHFIAATFEYPELPDDGAVVVVARSGGSRGAVSATLTTSDGTAIGGVNYAPVASEVLFADGESGRRAVRIPIIADDISESDKTVNLTLSDPKGCAALGARSTAVLTIMDDDDAIVPPPPPTFTIGGAVTGLAGTGLVLRQETDGSELGPTNGPFTFGRGLVNGVSYDVRVTSQPIDPRQACTVTNGAGTINNANVVDVLVSCVTLPPSGSLDSSFGSGGMVTTGVPGGTLAMALQADGKIVVVGGKTLARYTIDGTLDSSFDTDGQVTVVFTGGPLDAPQGVAIQPDGRIVVVGVARIGTNENFAVARYNADGSPDDTFGVAGRVNTDFNGSADRAWAVLVQPDDRIVVAGHAATSTPLGPNNDFAVARYTSMGDLDISFGNGGKVMTTIGGRTDLGAAAALLADGRILVAGRVADGAGDNPDVGLVRYMPDGNLDGSFGVGGIVRRDVSGGTWDEATDVAVQPDGKIVVAVKAMVGPSFNFAVARFEADGALDSAFGSGGVATAAFSTAHDFARGVALQADGKIVLVGQSSNLENPDLAVARFDASGTLDTGFGTGGKMTVDVFGSGDDAECVAVQPDGKIVIGGSARNGTTTGIALMRVVP